MSTILTDDERPKLPPTNTVPRDYFTTEQMEAYADAREAAVLAKLAQQEPVAWRWQERGHWFGWSSDWGDHDKAQEMGFPIEYAYPKAAPQQVDRQRVPEGWIGVVQAARDVLSDAEDHLAKPHSTAVRVALMQLDAMLAAAPEAQAPHLDDAAVDDFAQAMKYKLASARHKGREGWQTCPPEELSRMLREHVEKGDPLDVANFCMFLWWLGHGIAPAHWEQAAEPVKVVRVRIVRDPETVAYLRGEAPSPTSEVDGRAALTGTERQPLPQWQIDEIIKQHTGGFIGGMHFVHLARAIEIAHGIGGKDCQPLTQWQPIETAPKQDSTFPVDAPRNIIWNSLRPDHPVEWSNPGRAAQEGEVHYIRYDLYSDAVHAAPEAPAQASAVDEREKELKWLCAEAYQVVASMLNDLGAMETEKANKILDNLSQARFVHDDVLPWPALAQKGGVE